MADDSVYSTIGARRYNLSPNADNFDAMTIRDKLSVLRSGGFSGKTSGFGTSVVLPHSGIKIDIPRLAYYPAVTGSPRDRGVIPDAAISETVGDVLARRDPVLDAALAIARKP